MANFETSQIRLPNNDLLILKDTTARTAAATAQTTAETAQATADSKVTIVSWDATNKKLTKTINGSTTDIVAGSTILSGLTKAQVTSALGYTPPTEDTNTTYSLTQDSTDKHKFTLSGTDGSSVTVTIPDNNTTYTFAEGTTNGTFTVTPSGGSTQTVKIHGLGNAAYKGISDTYSSTSTDAISGKGVAAALASLPTPMVFKGSLGTGGTITTLPTASASNNGHSYKVITNGTYAGVSAKAGDMFISDGTQWVYIPSADEPSGTVTSIGITNGGGLSVSGSPITTSGTITISHADTSSQASVNNSGRTYIQDITLDTYGHVTGITSATETVVDTNTTYTIGTNGNNITLTPSSGSAQSITAPYATKALNNKDGESITATYRRLDDPYYDTVYATEEEVGDLIVTGAARFLNTINGSISGNAATATNVAWSGVTNKPTTLSGYGITDAKIANGVITLGSNTITPLTSHQTVSNKGTTLAWETTSTIATIGGTDIKVTMPSNPNTNTTYTLGADATNNKITLTPSSGNVQSITVPYATSAGSAGSATKATQDESGNNIKASYASSISISDHTITLKNKNGVSLGTVTVPDNNTTYSLSASGESVVLSGSDNSSNSVSLGTQLLPNLPTWTADPTDDVYLIRRDTAGSAAYGQVKFSTVWNYIKSKTDPLYFMYRGKTTTASDPTLYTSIGTKQYNGVLPDGLTGQYSWGQAISIAGENARFDMYVSHQASDTNHSYGICYRSGWDNDKRPWQTILDSNNYTAYTVKKDGTGATGTWSLNTYEANLQWGGKNFSSSYGCLDAALMDELGANRFQFIKASAITVEYSRDGGSTWTDYGATDAQKQQIFAQGGGLIIGKADSTNKATEHPGLYQLRITIDTGVAGVYTVLNKFVMYVNTNGSANCRCKIQKALQSTPTTFVDHTDWIPIDGWSGYNVLNTSSLTTYGNTASSQYGRVRFLFLDGSGGSTSYNGLIITQIKAFGGVGWLCPSTMAKTGHLYSYNENQDAIFPNTVQAPYHKGTTKMTLSAGKITQLTAGTAMLFADGVAISNPATANDVGWIRVLGTGESDTVMEIATGDDGGAGEQIVVRQYNTSSAVVNEATLLDKSGNTTFPKNVTATKFIGALQGNADTATTASKLSGFTSTTTSGTAIDSATQNGHVYVTGASGIYSQGDGACFVQAYSTSWVAQIYQDYRTGQIALRGKNNGTWQAWRKVWDSVNLKSETAAASGTTLSLVTTGEKYTWNSYGSGSARDDTKVLKAGDTMTGNLTLSSTSGNSPILYFSRGSTLTKWRVYVASGQLQFESSTDGSTWTTRAYFADNSGNLNLASVAATGNITAGGYASITGNVECNTIYANRGGNGTAGGISLYSNSAPSAYGIANRNTTQGGKFGYVQGDWAGYYYMSGAVNRGWIWRHGDSTNVTSVSGEGHIVTSGSLTLGGNTTNTSGVRQVYNSTTKSLDFVFVA